MLLRLLIIGLIALSGFMCTMVDDDDYGTKSNDLDEAQWSSSSSAASSGSNYTLMNNRNKMTGNQTQFDNRLKHQSLILLIRGQLKKELRKLKSSITDSILEEVINYYGKKLEIADVLKNDYETLNKRINLLSQNLNTLGQNFKTISKNHRNLVDIVRNNLVSSSSSSFKKHQQQQQQDSVSMANSRYGKSSNLVVRGQSNATGNVRSVENNLKKKSIDANKIIDHLNATDDHLAGGVDHHDHSTSPLVKEKLKLELLNDLETKYSNLFSEKLVDLIVKNFKNESKNARVDVALPSTTIATSKSNKHASMVKYDDIMSSDCQDLRDEGFTKDGTYKITVQGNKSFNVYCEFTDKIGWTLLQRRFDGSVNFYQNWKNYKNGFGNLVNDGEFWLGLEYMHLLTNQRNYSLQVVLTDWKDAEFVVEYTAIRIGNEASKYKLELGTYEENTSTAGDSLGDSSNNGQSHNHMPFSTFDSDNDLRFYDNCAQIFKSGWWFNACFQSNLNGIYYKYSTAATATSSVKPRLVKKEENAQLKFLRNGIHWNSIDFYKSLKSTKLRIRRSI